MARRTGRDAGIGNRSRTGSPRPPRARRGGAMTSPHPVREPPPEAWNHPAGLPWPTVRKINEKSRLAGAGMDQRKLDV
jgi:hypothetical protein